jgi:hypothetical protein
LFRAQRSLALALEESGIGGGLRVMALSELAPNSISTQIAPEPDVWLA